MIAEIKGKPLWVEIEGDGPPVLMVHGLGGTSTFYEAQVRALRDTHKVIRFDLEGHGRSPLSGTPDIKTWADDIGAILDHAEVDSVDIVAHSMGTIVAQLFAADQPERVGRLALLGPIRDLPDAARDGTLARAQTVRADTVAAVANAVAEGGTGSATKTGRPELLGYVRESLLRQTDEGYAVGCEALANSVDADLSEITAPVLLVTGTEDGVSPPEKVKLMAEAMGRCQVQIIDGIGHWTAIEAAQEVNASLADFLA